MLIQIQQISYKKMHFKILSGKLLPFCLCLNVLIAVVVKKIDSLVQVWIMNVQKYFIVLMQYILVFIFIIKLN